MTQPTTTKKNTSELVLGDVLRTSGMRVQLVAGGHTPAEQMRPGVFGFQGRILNVDEVDEAGVVPKGWRVRHLASGEVDPEYPIGSYWYVQGNELAHWTVEA